MTIRAFTGRGPRTVRAGLSGLAATFLWWAMTTGHAAGLVGMQTPPPEEAPQKPPGAQTEQPTPTFKSAVDLVTVDVSVVDATGRPVRGLEVDDFELRVDGEPRRIVSAQFIQQSSASGPPPSTQYSTNEGSEGGRLVMLIVDQGNIRLGAGGSYIRAAERLLDDLGPGDRVAVAIIPGGRMIEFTRHFTRVRQALRQTLGSADLPVTRRAQSSIGVAEALAYERGDAMMVQEAVERECGHLRNPAEQLMCRDQVVQEMGQIAADVRRRTQNTLTVLQQVLGGLTKVEGPKTVVMLTEGLYVDREYGQLTPIGRTAAVARAAMYAVVLDDAQADFDVASTRVSPTSGADRELRLSGISALIGFTRGATFSTSSNATTVFQRLSRELTGYYLIAFEPLPEERDGKSHDISVRVSRPRVEVRARREFSMARDRAATSTDDELLTETIRAPLIATELPVRVATYSFPDPEPGQVRVLITAGLGRVTDDAPVTGVAYRVTDEEDKLVLGRRYGVDPPRESDHRWNGTVTLRPGTYTLKLATIDGDGRRGSVEHQVKASLAQAGDLVIGDLMLSESDHAGDFQPEIEPTFGAATLEGYLEMSSRSVQQLRDATVAVEIADDANAPPLLTTEGTVNESRDARRAIGVATIALDALPPGEYVARAIIRSGGQPVARVLRPFTYAPTSAAVVAMGAGIGSILSVRFDRSQVLAPIVTGHFLAPLATHDETAVRRVEAASRGDFSPLAAGGGDGAAPGVSALLRGVALYAQGELEPSASEFRRAMVDNPDLTAAVFYLGACYAAGGKHKEAAGAWQTTLAAEDQPSFVYALAAEAFLRARNWEAALALAEEAAALWPDERGVARLRVRALALAGKRDLALEAVDQYLGVEPDDQEVVLVGLKLLYDAHADGRPVESATADRQKFESYLARYRAAHGSELALAERWLQVLTTPDPRR